MSTIIVFPSKTKADDLLKEISRTPAFENGETPINVYDWEEDKPLAYIKSQDGRVAIKYPFEELTRAWLMAYLQGQAEVLDAMPEDWQYHSE